ncbi:MAG TPA: histidine kinase dimerization/phospho-acceptor domain-containing protein, partial [Candidatus Binataceae bacterium]|nr:histidine kinase dimerization/phospho-acceptor domain-containing protein [Candidatus Binataceae bacterium]
MAAGFLPPALALVIVVTTGMHSQAWAIIAIGVGAVAGSLGAWGISNSIVERAERIDALAEALRAHRPPAHVIPDHGDVMTRAERNLLQATDTVIAEIGALTEQRDELDAVLRSMTEAVVVTGARGEVILLNNQARKTFALSAEANYAGRDFVELCRDPRLQEFVATSTSGANGEIVAAEVRIQNPSPRYLAVSAAPVKRASATRMGRLFVFHDITQLKTYETMRADFVANLTHEIRTPLSALYGYAETLERGIDDPDTAKRFLGIIERQAKRLARLVDDLLSLSNLERGLTQLKLEAVAPQAVLEDAAELMRERAERAGISIDMSADAEAPPIQVDRDKMHQLFVNLIDNAIKYTPRGG